jgi:hypothetical protein
MEDGTWALPPMGKVSLIYIKIISIYVSWYIYIYILYITMKTVLLAISIMEF